MGVFGGGCGVGGGGVGVSCRCVSGEKPACAEYDAKSFLDSSSLPLFLFRSLK